MRTVRALGIRDDHNHLSGAFGDRRLPSRPGERSGHGWAAVSIVAGLLWIGGLGSIVALATGFLARSDARRSGASLVPSTVGIALGALGAVGSVVFLVLVVTGASSDVVAVGAPARPS